MDQCDSVFGELVTSAHAPLQAAHSLLLTDGRPSSAKFPFTFPRRLEASLRGLKWCDEDVVGWDRRLVPVPGVPVCLADSCLSDCEYVSSDLTVLLFLAVWTPLRLCPAAGRCPGDKFLTSTAAKCLFRFSWFGLIYLMHLPKTPVIFFLCLLFF